MILPADALVLAPMAGYTDSPMRRLCRAQGADVVVTEMVAAQALVRNPRATEPLLAYAPDEPPVGVQLSTADPELIAPAMAALAGRGFAFVDLNAGCPMKNTTNGGAGAALLRDLPRLGRILDALRRESPLPVTLKIRLGWSEDAIVALEVARMAQDKGVRVLTVHGRTRAQMYRGHADWDWIARVREVWTGPLIGNGDVQDQADARRMRAHSGCDAVMIGRAAIGNPFVFERRPTALTTGARIRRTLATARAHLAESLPLARSPRLGVVAFRKHLSRYLKGIPHSRERRIDLLTLADAGSLDAALAELERAWEGRKDDEGGTVPEPLALPE